MTAATRHHTEGGRSTIATSEFATEDTTLRLALHCVRRVIGLLARHELHLHHDRLGETVHTPDGRPFVVYRESSCSEPCDGEPITMAMWFHLRWMPPGARLRAYLFERESIFNTILYAGFEGYRTKLWTFNHATNDYAGFYTWRGRDEAERYARYAMAMLGPISVPGSLGYAITD